MQDEEIISKTVLKKFINDNVKLSIIRRKRDELLINTDLFMLVDYPISEELREELKQYRQKLRDITNIDGLSDKPVCGYVYSKDGIVYNDYMVDGIEWPIIPNGLF